MGKEDDIYTFHRFANKFANEYLNRGSGRTIYHLKIRVSVFEPDHLSALVAFLVLSIEESEPTEFHISHYVSGQTLHVLIVFLDRIRIPDSRVPSQATIDNQVEVEVSDPGEEANLNSVL